MEALIFYMKDIIKITIQQICGVDVWVFSDKFKILNQILFQIIYQRL